MNNRKNRHHWSSYPYQAKRRRRPRRGARRALIASGAVAALLCVGVGAVLLFGAWFTPPAPPPVSRPPAASRPQKPDKPAPSAPAQTEALGWIPPPVHADNTAWNVTAGLPDAVQPTPQAPDYRMLALPENTRVDDSYFQDVTFVGDSITQALELYQSIPGASYCAYKGIGPRQIYDGSAWPRRTGEVEVPMEMLLASAPGKVYVLMGTNTMVNVKNDDDLLLLYDEMLSQIMQNLPGVQIYVQAITPVVPEVHASLDKARIDGLNNRLAALALEKELYFVNLQEALADEDGNLRAEYAGGDGYHLTPAACVAWREYLATHTAYDPANPYV